MNYLAQAHWHAFRYRFGEMIGLDRTSKEVRLAAAFDDEGREITPPRSVEYDTLVIAIGSVTNDFGTRGVAQYAVPLETPALRPASGSSPPAEARVLLSPWQRRPPSRPWAAITAREPRTAA